jgi:hypothetical protein
MAKYKYTINHLHPPAFSTIGGQRYLFPGWIPVEDNVTFDDVEHINPYANIKSETYEVIGSTGNKYIVTKRMNEFSCDCPAGKFRGTCKHSLQVKKDFEPCE